jgi:hypothetical protein
VQTYKSNRRRAARQAVVCLAVLAVIVAAVVVEHDRPDGPEELKIQIALLRSQAGEFALLAQERSRLPVRFAAAHSRQMLRKLERVSSDLDSLQLQQSDLRAMHRDAQRHAGELKDADSRSSAAVLLERQRELQRAESRLEHGQGR